MKNCGLLIWQIKPGVKFRPASDSKYIGELVYYWQNAGKCYNDSARRDFHLWGWDVAPGKINQGV